MSGSSASSVLPRCRPLLAYPDDLRLVLEPVVDLTAVAVAGYAARFHFPGTAGPDVWYAAAEQAGVAAELAALALHKALAARAQLPAGCFLSVRVDPQLLAGAPVRGVLADAPDLSGVVLALPGSAATGEVPELRRQVDALRSRGALLALESTGYPDLQLTTVVRPELITLDRAAVAGAHTDPVRRAVAETVGDLAARIDARLLVDGVETPGELSAVARLGIPLARGWLLGRPRPEPGPLEPQALRLVRAHATRAQRTGALLRLLRPVRQCDADQPVPAVPPAVLVDALGEPVALRLGDPRTGEAHTAPVSLRVRPEDDVRRTLQRALARPPAHRFDPVVCTDATGAVLGVLRVEDLVTAAGPFG